MRRKLFNLAAALSVVLCVGTLFAWVASYRFEQHVGVAHGPIALQLTCHAGRLWVNLEYDAYPFRSTPGWHMLSGFERRRYLGGWTPVRHLWNRVGFWVESRSGSITDVREPE